MAPINRREFMKWVGAGSAILMLPPGCATQSGFFTATEKRTLAALADQILPPDDTPGGAALGAVEYIEALLTALDGKTPTILRGGPYSGRQALPDATGNPSSNVPPDGFMVLLPLDRVQARAWHLRLYGSNHTDGGGPNDALLGPVVGLREQLRQGLAAAAGQPIGNVDPDFVALVYGLVAEAAFGAPEYGGNPGGAGWAMVHFEGDMQPLGFSAFDTVSGGYVERPDLPVTTANPGADPEPLDDATRALLDEVFAALGGRTFP